MSKFEEVVKASREMGANVALTYAHSKGLLTDEQCHDIRAAIRKDLDTV